MDMYVVKRILAFVKELGHAGSKIIVKSDQESAIKAVIDKVMRQRGSYRARTLTSEIVRLQWDYRAGNQRSRGPCEMHEECLG